MAEPLATVGDLPSTSDHKESFMKTRTHWVSALGLCAALGAAPALHAAEDEVVAAPSPQRYDTLSVINGGASDEEADAIKRIAPQYKLRVELSGRGGEYDVADRLTIKRNGEVVAEVPNAGPWLLMDVPAGRYTLIGEFADRQVQRTVTVADAGTTVHWVLPWRVD
jgi:hypothetical protein